MGAFDQSLEESRTPIYEFLSISKYHTKWSGYFRAWYIVARELTLSPDPLVSTLEFKHRYSIESLVNAVIDSGDEFTVDIGYMYAFPDLIDMGQDDFLFHHDYADGINLFLSEFKSALDKKREYLEEQERKYVEETQALEGLRQKYSKVITL